jgi:hypothetical protein
MARPIRTFVDSGVLIAAYKGSPSVVALAIDIRDDPNRVFLSSPFLRHEVSPKARVSKLGKQLRKLAEEYAASGGKLLNRHELEREIADRRGLR